MNKDAILINQDPTEQGKRIKVEGDNELWAKKLKNGNIAVLLLNRNKSEYKNSTLNFDEIGISHEVKIKDIYAGKELGSFFKTISRQIKPQAGVFMLVDEIK